MKKLAFAVCAALGLLSLPAMADENSGLYLGAGIGQGSINTDTVSVPGASYKFDANDFAYKIFGGWRFNKYFAAELDYVDLGNPSDKKSFDDGEGGVIDLKTEIGVSAFAGYLVGTLPIGIFELSAKLGYTYWDADLKASAEGFSDSASDSGEDFAWGVGAGMTFFDHLNAKIEYEALDISDANVDVIWLTGAWRF
jgi:opacity protein-like surface antigen